MSHPLRVLHVHSGNLYGGVESILVTLARFRESARALEWQFALCFDARLSEELRTEGIPPKLVGAVRISRPWTIMRARRRFRDLLHQERADLVITHSTWSHSIFAPTARSVGIRTVFWMHAPASGSHLLERLAQRVTPSCVICNSRYTRATLNALYPNAPASEVIYPPVEAPKAAAPESKPRALRAVFDTPEESTVILHVGRMEAWKGVGELLEAFARLKQVPAWTCWLVGGAQTPAERRYADGLRATARRLGIEDRVRFLGERSDVGAICAAADIYCQPNTAPEPFGISFVEALYAGLPVITTDFGGGAEVVDKSCGILVRPGHPDELASALAQLMNDPAQREGLASHAPARAKALCDPVAQVNRVTELLARVARSGEAPAEF